MLEGWQVSAVNLLQHCLGWAFSHMRICWDGWLAGVMDLAGVHMAQVVLSSNLKQETILVPLQKQHQHSAATTPNCMFGQVNAIVKAPGTHRKAQVIAGVAPAPSMLPAAVA